MSPSYAKTLRALTPIEARPIKVLYDFQTESAVPTLGSDADVENRLTFGFGLSVGEAITPIMVIEALEHLGKSLSVDCQRDLHGVRNGPRGSCHDQGVVLVKGPAE
jgi:hypothetical protein